MLQSLKMRAMLLLFLLAETSLVSAYCSSDINRRDMAGIWRFQGQFRPKRSKKKIPMKEFTVYPKKQSTKKEEQFMLKLSEDGSFQQTSDDASTGEKKKKTFLRGTWDFLDGKLILAAERPENEAEEKSKSNGGPDTILVGEVVATAEQKLKDNPALTQSSSEASLSEASSSSEPSIPDSSSSSESSSYDVYLSVPNGLVEVGKFTYPRHHPSFFDQPIFKPMPTGSFQLRQVLGNLNTKQEETKPMPKFHKRDFVDKKFFLTSHPIQPKKPKGRKRWSIKYNKFVHDAPPPPSEEQQKQQQQPPQKINIRVMEVQFFGNNTFSTVAGLGSAAILRGKWNIIGEEKDQLWMQVYRFGFGRSVSGSVYSEGLGLTHNDEKAYWGQISKVPQIDEENEDTNNDPKDQNEPMDSKVQQRQQQQQQELNDEEIIQIEVKGSVLDGWGLEPLPVARFTMVEKTEEDEYDDDDDFDDDDDGGLIQDKLDRDFGMNNQDDDINDSYSSPDAFQ